MPEPSHTDVELLLGCAAELDALAGDITAAHTGAHTAAESALGGWTGRSRAVMTETAARWAAATADLSGRLEEYADALRTGAHRLTAADATGAQALAHVRR